MHSSGRALAGVVPVAAGDIVLEQPVTAGEALAHGRRPLSCRVAAIADLTRDVLSETAVESTRRPRASI